MTSTRIIGRVREGAAGHERAVFDAGGSGGDGFDGAQDFGAAAEVVDQLHHAAAAGRDIVAVAGEAGGLGVAEAEDGLVDVADGVEAVGRAYQIDHARLLGVGVLKLVHQDVIELAAQAGLGVGRFFQQADGELLEVGEIERAGLQFTIAIQGVEPAQHVEEHLALGGVERGDLGVLGVLDLVAHAACEIVGGGVALEFGQEAFEGVDGAQGLERRWRR